MKLLKNIYLKETIKELIILAIIVAFILFPLPYYITIGGGTIDTSNRFEISGIKNKKGSFSLAYVRQLKGTPLTFVLGKLIPSWEVDSFKAYGYEDSESYADIVKRNHLDLNESLMIATKTAYQASGKTYLEKDLKYILYYVIPENRGDLIVGDELVSYDGKILINQEELSNYISTKEVGSKIKFIFKRGKKNIIQDFKVIKENERKIIGIILMNNSKYETDPKIKFKFDKAEQGSSGGVTLALSIYDALSGGQLSKGRKIVGTGTIEAGGRVGPIGGEVHKLDGAIKAKADIFIVPAGDNYKEVLKEAKRRKSKIKIIPVKTFAEAINALNEK